MAGEVFSDEETERYARQLVLRGFGAKAQLRLNATDVMIAGLGALGGPVALYLAAAGVGALTLYDPDMVSLSNLQRQPLFTMDDLGKPKAQIAAIRLGRVNPHVAVTARCARLDASAVWARRPDILVDATDNFPARFALNRLSRTQGVPLVSGAVGGWKGQVGVFNAAPGAPCYRCLVPETPPDAEDCQISGVIGPVCGVVASVMAGEVIKLITGNGRTLSGRVFLHDASAAQFRTAELPKDPACPECRPS